MSFRRFCILLFVVGLALFLRSVFLQHGVAEVGMPASGASEAHSDEGKTSSTEAVRLKGKLHEREPKKEHGIDEMFAGLREILPGQTEFPEQTLQERILAINALLKKRDIKLRLGMDEVLYPSPHLLDKNVPAFSQEATTLNHILFQAESSLKMTHYLSQDEGAVLLMEGSGG
ncbi:hypothetical protein [Luteolibacter soli]|uniref:Uncharacterized protein n=1 Tax=Luteolibacter soli TaxID=3135280 RepID=A0ABU9B249_9BACT